jgi:aldehyde:ferredoxin oxidoreductase
VMDSMILCKFLRGVFVQPFEQWAELLHLVTGWDITGAELRTTAERIVLSKRMFNQREGWTRADDWLPERFLSESLELDSGRTAALPAQRLREMIDGYYVARGLDQEGTPLSDRVSQLGLAEFLS